MNVALSVPAQTAAVALFYFFVYSFLGWVAEVAYAAFETHELVNRGFLNGPVCPIYGFGMLALVGLMGTVGQSLPLQFLVGMTVTTAIELVGGWVLYKLFHTRWWDYSMFPCNLGGYICLRFSLIWGVASLAMIRVVHPLVQQLGRQVLGLPRPVVLAVGAVLLALFGTDIGLSAAAAVGLDKYLSEVDVLRGRYRALSDSLTQVIGSDALRVEELLDEGKLQQRLATLDPQADLAELRGQLRELAKRARAVQLREHRMMRGRFVGVGRLVRAFPQMQGGHSAEAIASLRRWRRRQAAEDDKKNA